MQKRGMTVLMLRDAALTLSREPLPSRRRFAAPQDEAHVTKDAAPQHEDQVSPNPEEVRRTVSKGAGCRRYLHRLAPGPAALQEGEAFEQVNVLFVFDQGAMERRHDEFRVLAA